MATPLPPTFTVPASHTEARRDPLQHDELPPLFAEKITLKNWHKYVDWKHVIGLGFTPLIALYGLLTTEIQKKTAIWAVIYYFATGLGITAGKLLVVPLAYCLSLLSFSCPVLHFAQKGFELDNHESNQHWWGGIVGV